MLIGSINSNSLQMINGCGCTVYSKIFGHFNLQKIKSKLIRSYEELLKLWLEQLEKN